MIAPFCMFFLTIFTVSCMLPGVLAAVHKGFILIFNAWHVMERHLLLRFELKLSSLKGSLSSDPNWKIRSLQTITAN